MADYRHFSDIHGWLPIKFGDNEENEICLLNGDVTEFRKKGTELERLLRIACTRFKEVIFVPGNHEYYGTNIGTLESKVRKMMEDVDNFTLLQDGEYVERDGVRIIGATLWSDTSSIELEAQEGMNDYKYIRYGPPGEPWQRKLTPGVTTMLHHKSVKNIQEALKGYEGKSIVMTHHAPSFKSIDPRYSDSDLNPAYATELKLDKWPTYWIHGHIHLAQKYLHNGCVVSCWPMGYRGEHTGFTHLDNIFTA